MKTQSLSHFFRISNSSSELLGSFISLSLSQQRAVIKCCHTWDHWGVRSLGQTLSPCVVPPENQLALFDESSLSWRQVIWDPCCNRGQTSLSTEPSSRSPGCQRNYGCSPFLLPPGGFLWQSVPVLVAYAEHEYLTFQGLKHTDCIPDLPFMYMILPMQSLVCVQGLVSQQENFGFSKILA